MVVNKLAALGMAGLTLLYSGMLLAQDSTARLRTADNAQQLTQQTREHNQVQTLTGEEALTAQQVQQRELAQERIRQREQARLKLEQRLNEGPEAGNGDGYRGDGSLHRAASTRFGQGYESRMGGGHRSGSGSTGGRR